jgi:hypothetical protein
VIGVGILSGGGGWLGVGGEGVVDCDCQFYDRLLGKFRFLSEFLFSHKNFLDSVFLGL